MRVNCTDEADVEDFPPLLIHTRSVKQQTAGRPRSKDLLGPPFLCLKNLNSFFVRFGMAASCSTIRPDLYMNRVGDYATCIMSLVKTVNRHLKPEEKKSSLWYQKVIRIVVDQNHWL